MKALKQRYIDAWLDSHVRFSAPVSFVIFLIAIFGIQPIAIEYSTSVATSPVGDIILSNIPVYNVGWFFVYGMFALVAFITALCLWHPRRIAFTLHSLTLFVLIRSVFVSLTHIGSFTPHAVSNFGPGITDMFFAADLFFSGHTGAPFLMALMYWHKPVLRDIFLIWSVFFAVLVLMGHLHYSIDVLAAYFITFTIYQMALWLFPRERAQFLVE